MINETNKDRGRIGMSMGVAYFGSNGYTVSIPLNDTQVYDFIIEKDGIFQTVQCKCIANKDNRCDFRNTGGTNGSVYGNALQDNIDYLFCYNVNRNEMFCIPRQHLIDANVKQSVKLQSIPATNNQGFSTYKYLVTF